MSRNRRNRGMTYADVYRNIKKAQLNTWLLLVFLVPITLPNIAFALAYQRGLNIGIAFFGLLAVINAIRNLTLLRRQKKALMEDPENFVTSSSEIGTNNFRQLFWFNKF